LDSICHVIVFCLLHLWRPVKPIKSLFFLHTLVKVPSLVLANWWNLGLTFVSKWMI
jgi:hypothetical protein